MSTEASADWPGNGGLRVRSYDSADEAEAEAKALSDAMTLKHAAYNTGFTGAKLVFDSKVNVNDLDKEQLMNEVARTLASEQGSVYTGCDINTTDGYATLHCECVNARMLAEMQCHLQQHINTTFRRSRTVGMASAFVSSDSQRRNDQPSHSSAHQILTYNRDPMSLCMSIAAI